MDRIKAIRLFMRNGRITSVSVSSKVIRVQMLAVEKSYMHQFRLDWTRSLANGSYDACTSMWVQYHSERYL